MCDKFTSVYVGVMRHRLFSWLRTHLVSSVAHWVNANMAQCGTCLLAGATSVLLDTCTVLTYVVGVGVFTCSQRYPVGTVRPGIPHHFAVAGQQAQEKIHCRVPDET